MPATSHAGAQRTLRAVNMVLKEWFLEPRESRAGGRLVWKLPCGFRLLRLDRLAVVEAFGKGEWEATDHVLMSRATLVVVPDTLVEHWQEQIDRHVKPGALKVAQLGHASAVVGRVAWGVTVGWVGCCRYGVEKQLLKSTLCI